MHMCSFGNLRGSIEITQMQLRLTLQERDLECKLSQRDRQGHARCANSEMQTPDLFTAVVPME